MRGAPAPPRAARRASISTAGPASRSPTLEAPAPERVRAIRDRLRELYGSRRNDPHGHPIAELVRTILSQNTNDRNRDVAYGRLRDRFDDWEAIRDAPVEEVIEAIRPGRPAPTSRARGSSRSCASSGPDARPRLARGQPPRGEAIDYLTSLPGVGRKTAACVMIFALGRPEIPVDTHVHRVGGRLGLFPPGISLERAHDEMLAITDPDDAYELHINLITHGRRVCRPRPRCGECALARMCVARRAGLVDPVA